jgi:hypothetical protein
MDRAAFENVYLHANCLAELGLARALAAAAEARAQEPAPAPSATPPTRVEEDESALRGVLGFGEPTPEQLAEQVARVEAALRGEPSGAEGAEADDAEPFGVAIGVGFLDPEWGAPDVALYLAQAQEARPALRARIDRAFARADAAALAASLAALPTDLPALSADLDADALEAWLRRYEAGEAAVVELVVQVRRLEPVR